MEDRGLIKNKIYYIKTTCVITGGILVHLCLGSFYIFGNISPYMISYLRNRTNEHSLRNEDNLWIMNAASIAGPFAMTLGGLLNRYLGVRIATGIGCIIFCSGVALTYFTIKKSLVLVALSYGLLTNFGSFIAYGPPAQTAVKWLPEKPTFAVGLIVCGFGGGALVFNQVVTAYINPHNLSPDLETSDGEKYFTNKAVLDRIPKVFLLLAGIYVCLQFLGVLLIFSHPRPKTLTKYQIKDEQVVSEDSETSEEERLLIIGANKGREDNQVFVDMGHEPVKTVLLRMLTNKNVYVWLVILFLVYGGMTFVNSLYKTYGQTFISDDHFLALVGSISSIFNSICRPMWGIIMDRYGFQSVNRGRRQYIDLLEIPFFGGIRIICSVSVSYMVGRALPPYLIAVKVASTCFVCLLCTLTCTETLGKVAFMVWICGLYGSSSFVWAVGPATLAKLFGADHMAINMGFLFVAVAIAAITGGFVGIGLQDVLGWHGLFLLAGCMGVTAFLVTFLFDGKDTDGRPI